MKLFGLIFVLAILLGTATADQWPAAQVKEVFSESREWFVRVIPGKSVGDTWGFASEPKGPYATAEFYRRQADRSYRLVSEITLLNPVAPVLFLVTDRGYLVTLDNWHNMGYGKVAAFYSPDGRVVKAYELKDLFSGEEIAAFRQSVSSIWWRKEMAYIRPGQQSAYLMMNDKGSELIFETETGAWQYCEDREGKHACRSANTERRWSGFREPPLRP